MRDLGYFCLDQLTKIDGKQAFFLSRLPSSVGVYLYASDAFEINTIEYIQRHFPHQGVIDINVYLGKEKFPVRLIATGGFVTADNQTACLKQWLISDDGKPILPPERNHGHLRKNTYSG